MDTATSRIVTARVTDLVNAVLNLEKGRTFQLGGRRIYPSEVHLLLALDRSPDATATELAAGLRVTKGAVSQTLARLERKGLLVKARDPGNRQALSLGLTADGAETVAYFRGRTARMRERVEKHLASLSADEGAAIAGFLEHVTWALEAMASEA